jgi:hypothetical protein
VATLARRIEGVKLTNGRCRDGEIVHYWNPVTSERLDILVRKTANGPSYTPLEPQSRLELKFGAPTAYASIGESFGFNGGTITVNRRAG